MVEKSQNMSKYRPCCVNKELTDILLLIVVSYDLNLVVGDYS